MNIFGKNFQVITWGESHGIALGAVIDGCPAGVLIDELKIAERLQEDVPDLLLGTTREELNPVLVLSGLSGFYTIGTPIALVIPNMDVKSSPYKSMEDAIRPGHGDFTYQAKYGHADLRGGGRASGRECIARLAAGEIARQLILSVFPGIKITARVTEMAGLRIESSEDYLKAQKSVLKLASIGESTGGEVSLVIRGLPAGVGSPVFGKLEAKLASALMGIGAVKSFEIGIGKKAKELRGSRCNDSFIVKKNPDGSSKFGTETNHAGGVLAGISNGEEISIRLSVKPTPTISKEQATVNRDGLPVDVSYKGRYDKNITPRIVPISEAMSRLVIADELLGSGFIHPSNVKMTAPYYPERIEIFKQKISLEQGKVNSREQRPEKIYANIIK